MRRAGRSRAAGRSAAAGYGLGCESDTVADMDDDDRRWWVPVVALSPPVVAAGVAIILAEIIGLSTSGLGVTIAAAGGALLGFFWSYAAYLGGKADEWRRDTCQSDAGPEEAIKGLIEARTRGVYLSMLAPGLLIGAPLLMVVGLAIAAVGAF